MYILLTTVAIDQLPLRKQLQGDHHSIDNVKFPDGSRHSPATLSMLSVTHIMPIIVLLSVVGVGIKKCMT